MLDLTRTEWLICLMPAALASAIVLVFYGGDAYTVAVVHSVVSFLTLPGFIALEFARILFMHGNIMGDEWDFLCIPLYVVVVFLVIKAFHYLDRKFPKKTM